MSNNKGLKKTGKVILILLFPVFFVSIFYVRGKRLLGFDQKKNTVENISKVNSDTLFTSVDSLSFKDCKDSIVYLPIKHRINIVSVFPSQSKHYKNELNRIYEGYGQNDNVNIIVFDTNSTFIEKSEVDIYCLLSSTDLLIDQFNLTSNVTDSEIVKSLILIDNKGYVKGVYDGSDKRRIDDLLLETKVLETKIRDEKR